MRYREAYGNLTVREFIMVGARVLQLVVLSPAVNHCKLKALWLMLPSLYSHSECI